MNYAVQQALENVLLETFEAMVFNFAAERDEPAPDIASSRHATVEFSGPFGGRITLGVSDEMLTALAANMLGLEPGESPTPQQQDDALGELLNVVCGNLLPVVAGPQEVFNVHKPVIGAQPAQASADATAGFACWMDDGYVWAWALLDESACLLPGMAGAAGNA